MCHYLGGAIGYACEHKSYGLTTLKNPHIRVNGADLRFNFKGKSGKVLRLQVHNRRVAKVVKACQELPGQQLFEYKDDSGEIHGMTSSDVNAYLREIAELEITAKDFRTWAGTVHAAVVLQELGQPDNAKEAKKALRAAIAQVAARLCNTIAICRRCYVHPYIVESFIAGRLVLTGNGQDLDKSSHDKDSLSPEEAAVLAFMIEASGPAQT